MARGELVGRTNVKHVDIHYRALPQQRLDFSRRKRRKRGQFRQRRSAGAVDLRVLEKIFGTRRKIRGQLRNEFSRLAICNA